MNPIDALSSAQETLLKSLEGISDDEADNGFVTGNWCVRDLVGNLDAHEKVLEGVLSSQILPRTGGLLFQLLQMKEEEFDIHNYEIRKYLRFTEVMNEYNSTHQHVILMLSKQITPEMLTEKGSFPWFNKNTSIEEFIVNDNCLRKKKYAEQISKFRKHLNIVKHNPTKL